MFAPEAPGRCARIEARMNEHIQKLIELQDLDLHIAQLRRQVDAYPQQIAEIERGSEAARAALAAAKQRVLDLHKDRKKHELDIEDWRGKIRKYKDQVMQVKSNDAYRALQEEIRGAEAELGKAEDRLLEQMMGGEQAEKDVKRAEAALAEAEAAARSAGEKIKTEQSQVEKEMAELQTASQARLADLPQDLVDHYHRIARRHGGIAVAAVRDEACSMCSVRIRPHVMQLLRQSEGQEIFHCETCTRILYFVEKPASPAEENAEAAAAESEKQ